MAAYWEIKRQIDESYLSDCISLNIRPILHSRKIVDAKEKLKKISGMEVSTMIKSSLFLQNKKQQNWNVTRSDTRIPISKSNHSTLNLSQYHQETQPVEQKICKPSTGVYLTPHIFMPPPNQLGWAAGTSMQSLIL